MTRTATGSRNKKTTAGVVETASERAPRSAQVQAELSRLRKLCEVVADLGDVWQTLPAHILLEMLDDIRVSEMRLRQPLISEGTASTDRCPDTVIIHIPVHIPTGHQMRHLHAIEALLLGHSKRRIQQITRINSKTLGSVGEMTAFSVRREAQRTLGHYFAPLPNMENYEAPASRLGTIAAPKTPKGDN